MFGRDLSGGATADVTLNVIPAGTLYDDRSKTWTLASAKITNIARTRTQFDVDINLRNTDTRTKFNKFVLGGA
jgi:hypothetical protein